MRLHTMSQLLLGELSNGKLYLSRDQSCLPQAHGFNLEPHEFIRGSSQWRVKANYKEKALYVADI